MFRSAKRTFTGLFVSIALAAAALAVVVPIPVLANHCNPQTEQELSIAIQDPNNPTQFIHCVQKDTTTLNDNPIIAYLKMILQFLAAGIGIALVGGLVVGGIVYMTARANPQQIQKAEEIIRNAIIGIALYVFMFAIINFLIPGGLLN